jgi:uncharacterized membrane protein
MLAISPPAQEMSSTLDVFVMVAILGGLICCGFFLICWIRKRMGPSGGEFGMPFSLAALRDLLAQGEISQDEYDRAKESMIDRVDRSSPADRRGDVP